MPSPYIGVHYNGTWDGASYVGGKFRAFRVPDGGFTKYHQFLMAVLDCMGTDFNGRGYTFQEVLEFGNGLRGPSKIKTNEDVGRFMESSCPPQLYVFCENDGTRTPVDTSKNSFVDLSSPAIQRQSFTDLLNAVSPPTLRPKRLFDEVNEVHEEIGAHGPTIDVSTTASHSEETREKTASEESGEKTATYEESGDDTASEESGNETASEESGDETASEGSYETQVDSELSDNESRENDVTTPSTAWSVPGIHPDDNVPETGPVPSANGPTCQQYKRTKSGVLVEKDIYLSRKELQTSVFNYHLTRKAEWRSKRTSRDRMEFKCPLEGCSFRVNASGKTGLWRITKVTHHSCKRDAEFNAERRLPLKLIGHMFAAKQAQSSSNITPADIREELQNEHGMIVLYPHAYRAKVKMNEELFGHPDESFRSIPSYLHVLKSSNPGTVTAYETNANCTFKHAFFALGASIEGFTYGRRVIVVDGAHLRGKHKGVVFAAVTQDANHQIFPLATGIGPKENNESWTWFLEQLKAAYGEPPGLVIVSDQHASIKHAVEIVFRNSVHSLCYYHLKNQIKKYGSNVVDLYKEACFAYRLEEHYRIMACIQAINNRASVALGKIGADKWSRVHCKLRRYEFMTSNAAESWNAHILSARDKPIVFVLETIWAMMQSWHQVRRVAAEKHKEHLCTRVSSIICTSIDDCKTYLVEQIDSVTYKVISGVDNHIVNLDDRTCECYEFQKEGIPCTHTLAAIRRTNFHVKAFVDICYTNDHVQGMWKKRVMPIPDPKYWTIPDSVKDVVCNPPKWARPAGRPKMKRRRSHHEKRQRKRRKQRCSRCDGTGHNRVNCHTYVPLEEENTCGAPALTESSTASIQQPTGRRCGACRVVGHTVRTCPSRIS